MVSLFSLFSSKKRPKSDNRPTSPTSPKRVRSVRIPTKPTSSAQFKAEAARRASSEGHALAARRLKASTASAALSCTTSSGNAHASALRLSPSPAPPRINISLPFEASTSKEDLDASLGLDGVGRTPTLTPAERRVLDAQRYTPDDLQSVWEWLGPEFATRGAETVGIMLPRRLETSKDRQRELASLFVLARRPELADKFPSLASRYPTVPQDQAADEWRSRLVAVAKDTPNPVDLAEVLKTILRRLAGNARPIIDPATYVRFVQQEHAASYPRLAYANMLVPHLSDSVVGLLAALFEVVSAIAMHADSNSMSAGRLCHLFGWWLLGSMPDGATSWNDLYDAYRLAGQRAEHLYYARVRWQTTQQKMPRRLVHLILSYPFGESSASSEHLPLPPASTFLRKVLHVTLGTDSAPPTGTDPDKTLSDALIAKLDDDVTAPAWDAIRNGDKEDNAPVTLETVLSTNSRDFLAELAAAKGLDFTTPPATPSRLPEENKGSPEFHYQPFDSLNGRRRSMSCEVGGTSSVVGSDDNSGSPKRGVVRQSSAINLTSASSSSSPAPPPQWDDFLQSGFGDTSQAVSDLSLSLKKPPTPLRLSAGSHTSGLSGTLGSLHLQVPKKRVISDGKTTASSSSSSSPSQPSSYVISSEEIIDMEDGFIHFVEDGQLDPVASGSWPRFALVQLAKPVNESSESVDWLLVTVKKREEKRDPSIEEPLPDLRSPDPLRSLSPTSAHTSTSRFSTAFGFGSLANRFRRKSYFAELASHAEPTRSRSLQPLTYKSQESKHVSKLSAGSDVPTEYTVGEMGEIVKIPSFNSPPTSPTQIQMDPVLARTSPSDWVYLAEGGAHVVFRYRGSDAALQGRAMRLVKTAETEGPGVALRNTWSSELLPQLVPANLINQPQSANVDEKWTRAIVTPTELMRPAERRDGKTLAEIVDYARPAQLMDDLTCGVAGEKVLAIEIKPKWGFVPQAQHLTPAESIAIKTRNCRWCLHQHYRGENVEGGVTYCPLDLYSGDNVRVRHALEGLWEMWKSSNGAKNNLRVYVDGTKVLPASGDLIPVTRGGSLSEGTADFLVPLLEKSGVLATLKQLQSTLDATNISSLAAANSAQHGSSTPFTDVPEVTAAELTAFVKLYLADPVAGGRENAWNLRQREIAFALSAIFKDCSVIVRAVLRPTTSSIGYELDEAKSSVKIIDTDLKPVTNLRKWWELDEKLWRHWLETKGNDEPTIVIGAEPTRSFRNLAKTVGVAGAGAGLAGAAAAAAAAGLSVDDASSIASIASIDAANTALADAIPESKAQTHDDEENDIIAEPEVRAALQQFDNEAKRAPETLVVHEPSPEVPERELSIERAAPAETTRVSTAIVPTPEESTVPANAEVIPEPAPVGKVAAAVPASDDVEGPVEALEAAKVSEPVSAAVESESASAEVAEPAEPAEKAAIPVSASPAVEGPVEEFGPSVETAATDFVVDTPVAEVASSPGEAIPAETPAAEIQPSSATTGEKASLAALAAVGAGAAATAAALPSKDASAPAPAFTSPVAAQSPLPTKEATTPVATTSPLPKEPTSPLATSPSGNSLSTPSDSPTIRRKISGGLGLGGSRVARISSLFNRRASGGLPEPIEPKGSSPTKTFKAVPLPKSPKREKIERQWERKKDDKKDKKEDRDDVFGARFRKPKKSGADAAPLAAAGVAAAGLAAASAAVVAAKDDVKEKAKESEKEEEEKKGVEPEHQEVAKVEPQTQEPEIAQTAEEEGKNEGDATVEAKAEEANNVGAASEQVGQPETQVAPASEPVAEQMVEVPAEPHEAVETPAESQEVIEVSAEPAVPASETAAAEEATDSQLTAVDASPVKRVDEAKAADPIEEAEVTPSEHSVVSPLVVTSQLPQAVEAEAQTVVPPVTEVAPVTMAADIPDTKPLDAETVDFSETAADAPPTEKEPLEPSASTHASPHTPAMPIRDNFSSVEATPASPYTPAMLARQASLSYPSSSAAFPRLSAFGDDLRLNPELFSDHSASPVLGTEPTIMPTKSIESPVVESPLRKADTAFPRLSAFIDKDAPGIAALRDLGNEEETPKDKFEKYVEVPTPIKEEGRSLQPSPNVMTFAESGVGPTKTPPLDAFGISIPDATEAPASAEHSKAEEATSDLVAPAAAMGTGYDSDVSSLLPPSEARLKRSTAPSPSPSPHLPCSGAHEPFDADLSYVAEELSVEAEAGTESEPEPEAPVEPAADESQLLADLTIDLSSPVKLGSQRESVEGDASPEPETQAASAPEHVEHYTHAALPPLPAYAEGATQTKRPAPISTAHLGHAKTLSTATDDMGSEFGSDAFATAPVSPEASGRGTPIVSLLDDADRMLGTHDVLALPKVAEEAPTPRVATFGEAQVPVPVAVDREANSDASA